MMKQPEDDETPPDETPPAIDTTNKFMVMSGRRSDTKESYLSIGYLAGIHLMSHADALNLAAYLVLMIGDDELWRQTLKAIGDV